MQTLTLIGLIVFFTLSILFLTLYFVLRNKFVKLQTNYEKSQKDFQEKNQKIKDELISDINRIGFYEETINLVNKDDKKAGKTGEPYDLIVYVKEIDRYTNGFSKIKMTNLELISGFDHSQYTWVKQCVTEKFSSLKKTSDVEWLESEEDIKELRKQKLAKLEKILEI